MLLSFLADNLSTVLWLTFLLLVVWLYSGGRAGHPVIGKLVVWFLAAPWQHARESSGKKITQSRSSIIEVWTLDRQHLGIKKCLYEWVKEAWCKKCFESSTKLEKCHIISRPVTIFIFVLRKKNIFSPVVSKWHQVVFYSSIVPTLPVQRYLKQIISCCLLHVRKDSCGKYPDLIHQKLSKAISKNCMTFALWKILGVCSESSTFKLQQQSLLIKLNLKKISYFGNWW